MTSCPSPRTVALISVVVILVLLSILSAVVFFSILKLRRKYSKKTESKSSSSIAHKVATTESRNKSTKVKGKRNKKYITDEGDRAEPKVEVTKHRKMSLTDMKCKENEAYGGVAAGYKVIREVTLSLQETSESNNVCVSSNKHIISAGWPYVKTPNVES